MQRVLSFQMNQREHDYHASETISKRFCCSVLFTTAFLSIVGGYLLGRYATERAILIKQLINDEERRNEVILYKFINSTHTLTALASKLASNQRESTFTEQLYIQLQCQTITYPDVNIFKMNPAKTTKDILHLHLTSFTACLNNASDVIKSEINNT